MKAILAIATTTVGEAIRRKVLLVILLIGLLLLSIAPGLKGLTARSEMSTIMGLMLGIIQITSAVIAIVLTVYLIPNEIERRTIYTILSKPVQRWQFLVGKFLGAIIALGLMMLLMSIMLVLASMLVQSGGVNMSAIDFSMVGKTAKASMFFFVQMSLLSAVSMCFSTFVSPLLNFFLSGGVFFVGTVLSSVYDTFAGNPNTHMVVKGVAKVVTVILPNFSYYNVQNPIINPGQQIQSESMYAIWTSVYGLIYVAALLVISIIMFDKREV